MEGGVGGWAALCEGKCYGLNEEVLSCIDYE